jgi:hypothetical protein
LKTCTWLEISLSAGLFAILNGIVAGNDGGPQRLRCPIRGELTRV